MRLHEPLACPGQRPCVARGEELVDRLGGEPAASHGVVDAFARGGCDDAGGVARQHDVGAIVPARQRLHRDRCAFAANRLRALEACRAAQVAGCPAQREPLLGGAHADARRVAVREDPAVEVRRDPAGVVHVAALRVEASVAVLRRAHDLVVRGDVLHLVGARDLLVRDRGVRAVGADHRAHQHRLERGVPPGRVVRAPVVHARRAAGFAGDVVEQGRAPDRAGLRGALAQPFVEVLAIDHPDVAAIDGHVHGLR